MLTIVYVIQVYNKTFIERYMKFAKNINSLKMYTTS